MLVFRQKKKRKKINKRPILFRLLIKRYITYGVVFVQFHLQNQSRDIQNI